MIHLGGALVLGVLVQLPALVASHPVIAVLFPTLLHLLVVGWITQVIFGVAYWMFPRYSAEQPRGSERVGWSTFASRMDRGPSSPAPAGSLPSQGVECLSCCLPPSVESRRSGFAC